MRNLTLDYNNLKMIRDNVFIEKDVESEHPDKIGRIYIPKTANATLRESKIGWLRRVGTGYVNKYGVEFPIPLLVEGQRVFYARYSGKNQFVINGETTVIVCSERSVLAVIDSDDVVPPIYSIILRNGRLLVKTQWDEEVITSSGIIASLEGSQSTDNKSIPHKVIMVDDFGGAYNWETKRTPRKIGLNGIVVGDVVLTDEYAGAKVTLMGENGREEFRLVSTEDVQAIVK